MFDQAFVPGGFATDRGAHSVLAFAMVLVDNEVERGFAGASKVERAERSCAGLSGISDTKRGKRG